MVTSAKGLVCALGFVFVMAAQASVPFPGTPLATVAPAQDAELVELPVPVRPVIGQQEVASGKFSCRIFPDQQYEPNEVVLSFSGTAGIASTKVEVGGYFDNATADICERLRPLMIAKAKSLGCATGQVENRDDYYLVERAFKFACHGSRDHVVNAIGELSEKLLTETP